MILVTGATGFIGSHLVEKLAASGVPACVLVRRLERAWPCPAFCGDLTTGSGLEDALSGVDTAIHLAGATKAVDYADYYRSNVAATATLARALRERGIRLVHVSSLAAIGPGSDGQPVDENTPPHPVSQYGRSKLEGERVAREIIPETVIVRPPVVYGPCDRGVLPLLKSVARGWSLEIAGGERYFTAVYVGDLVDGLIRASAPGVPAGSTYFLGHATPNTWTTFTSTAARIMRVKPRTIRLPLQAALGIGYCADIWSHLMRLPVIISRDKIAEAQCRFWVCDSRRAKTELGWEASTSIESGLAETLAWYREAGWIRY